MKIAGLIFVVALVVGAGQVVSGQDGHAGHDGHDGHDHSQPNKVIAKRDQLRIAVQAICPISGAKLGEHGKPIKVAVGKQKEQIFLCCKGCLKKKIDAKHWATIHANIAKAQRVCTVMGKPLPKKSKWTIVQGQIVYVCCPPCTKKIAADPKKYLKKVDELYTASLKAKRERR